MEEKKRAVNTNQTTGNMDIQELADKFGITVQGLYDLKCVELEVEREEIESLTILIEAAKVANADLREQLKAEREKFLRSIELLESLADIQNGPPLVQHEAEWNQIMDEVYTFISTHTQQQNTENHE